MAFAARITDGAHGEGLAVGQKNTLELIDDGAAADIGFDFAITEECGQFDECGDYADAYADRVIDIEYTQPGFEAACEEFGSRLSIVRRDLEVGIPDSDDYVIEQC